MKIYFDNTEIDNNLVMGLSYEGKMFNDNDIFTLGATVCQSVKLTIVKDSLLTTPSVVVIQENGVTKVYNIDNKEEENGNYIYTLVDDMVKFNFRYDAQPLIEASQTTETDGTKYVTLLEILEDICDKAEVTLLTNDFLGKNKHISWYDNTVTAREYISMIAELNAGYAIIDGGLKLEQYTTEDDVSNITNIIDIEDCAKYNIGEQHEITRIAIENGIFSPVGTTTGSTIYINENNVYITEQQDLVNIYNLVNGMEFYSLDIEKGNIDLLPIGSLFALTDNFNYYRGYMQVSCNYNGGWYGNYKFLVGSPVQEETASLNSVEDNYKRLKAQIDRENNKIEFLVAESQVISDAVTGSGSVAIHNAYEGLLHSLELWGQLDGMFPSSSIYPKSDIYPQSSGTLKINDTIYHLDIDQLNYISPSVCDKFIYEEGKCKIYRMVEIVGGVKTPIAMPYYEDREDVQLMVENNSTITLMGHPTINMSCKYLLNNQYTREFANKIETQSSIELTNDKIVETVSAVMDGENKVTPASIMLAVNNDESSIKLEADKLDLTGYITATDLAGTGTTTINGSNITTGTIDASQVNVTHLNASNITSGTINGNNVNVTNLNASNINTGTINGITVSNSEYQFKGTICSIRLYESGSAGVIKGYYGNTVSSDSEQRFIIYSQQSGGRFQTFDSSGAVAYYFSETGQHASSDIRYKKHIKEIEQTKSMDIITNLNPIEYDYDKPQKYRGVSAQDVEMLLNRNGYYNQVYNIEDDGKYTLQYEQLIPDLINCIKYLNNKIIELENKEEK